MYSLVAGILIIDIAFDWLVTNNLYLLQRHSKQLIAFCEAFLNPQLTFLSEVLLWNSATEWRAGGAPGVKSQGRAEPKGWLKKGRYLPQEQGSENRVCEREVRI